MTTYTLTMDQFGVEDSVPTEAQVREFCDKTGLADPRLESRDPEFSVQVVSLDRWIEDPFAPGEFETFVGLSDGTSWTGYLLEGED